MSGGKLRKLSAFISFLYSVWRTPFRIQQSSRTVSLLFRKLAMSSRNEDCHNYAVFSTNLALILRSLGKVMSNASWPEHFTDFRKQIQTTTTGFPNVGLDSVLISLPVELFHPVPTVLIPITQLASPEDGSLLAI